MLLCLLIVVRIWNFGVTFPSRVIKITVFRLTPSSSFQNLHMIVFLLAATDHKACNSKHDYPTLETGGRFFVSSILDYFKVVTRAALLFTSDHALHAKRETFSDFFKNFRSKIHDSPLLKCPLSLSLMFLVAFPFLLHRPGGDRTFAM